MKKIIGAIAAALVAATLIACGAGSTEKPAANDSPKTAASANTAVSSDPRTTATPAAQPSPAKSTKAPTVAQQNAIGTAEDYLATTAFSRKGLIGQLKFEGYSTADATYAVDHITVNWTEQADKMAHTYMEQMHFSRSGLIKQLEFEGFTSAQAAHGAKSVGL